MVKLLLTLIREHTQPVDDTVKQDGQTRWLNKMVKQDG